jgi:light-regulated signal transduction histidine kinase (bacteriophytochrome)
LIARSPEEVIGRRLSEVSPDFFASDRFSVYLEVLRTGHPGRAEFVLRAADEMGTPLPPRRLESSVVRMGDSLVVSGRDVTDRRDAEDRIRELNRQLAQKAAELRVSNQELESFAYSVAHDLRTPLRAVAGFTDLLARAGHIAADDEDGHRLIGRVTAGAAKMGELIDALLELAQISRRSIEISPLDLGRVAHEIADDLRAGGDERTVEFVIEDGLTVRADERLVRTLLRSLLENAWKYSAGRQSARIEVGRAGPGLFVVRDNGAGFDMTYADQLFKPFARLHRQDEFPGTGVGLATADRIVRRHGGRIRGEGRVGEGAAFYFSLGPQSEARSADGKPWDEAPVEA